MDRNKFFKRVLAACFLLGWTCLASAVIETYEFSNDADHARYQHLTEILRCPKCQNQNLAGSNSPIAEDLRREIAREIKEGKQDQEIIDFMVARYGDFVLYDPRFQKNTFLLWLAPLGFLLFGLLAVYFILRWQRKETGFGRSQAQVPAYKNPSPIVPLDGLKARRMAQIVFIAAFVFVCAGSWLLYRYLGAAEPLKITGLTRQMYDELTLAAHEQRQPNPVYAQKLIAELLPYMAAHPDDVTMAYLLGSTYAHIDDYEKAIPWYKNYLMAVPTDEEALTEYIHILYFAAGRQLTDRVQFVIDRALTLNPDNLELLGLLAKHHFEQGEYKESLGYWRHMLALVPKDSESWPALQSAITLTQQRLSNNSKTVGRAATQSAGLHKK